MALEMVCSAYCPLPACRPPPRKPVLSPILLRLGLCRPGSRAQPQAGQQNSAIKPAAATHTGWISRSARLKASEARARIDLARNQARPLGERSFTEPVVAKDNRKLFRARLPASRAIRPNDLPDTEARRSFVITVRN
jgi:D-alanyl-D-alanine carboxypeptidase